MFEISGGNDSMVASSRVRLARNIKGYSYAQQPPETLREIADKVMRALAAAPALAAEFTRTEVRPNSAEAQSMVERHLISPALAARGGFVIASRGGQASVLIGEEDHLRLQVMGEGLCLRECLEEAQRLARVIESRLPMDYDERLGYLTACPTNVGTGMRASVMLHLPLLTQAGSMEELIGWAGRQGCAVRGLFGEGTTAQGGFYQISNQVTLGRSEDALVAGLMDVCKQMIEAEQQVRRAARRQDETGLSDRLCRAAGILQTARRMDSAEASELLSGVLVGLQQGILQGAAPQEIYRALREIRPATLSLRDKRLTSPAERDAARAAYLRREVGGKLRPA